MYLDIQSSDGTPGRNSKFKVRSSSEVTTYNLHTSAECCRWGSGIASYSVTELLHNSSSAKERPKTIGPKYYVAFCFLFFQPSQPTLAARVMPNFGREEGAARCAMRADGRWPGGHISTRYKVHEYMSTYDAVQCAVCRIVELWIVDRTGRRKPRSRGPFGYIPGRRQVLGSMR